MTGPGIVVVGAGECGTRAAFTLREEGFDGAITLVGAEPELPYERPPLSKTWALRPLCDAAALRDARIGLLRGVTATGLDPGAHRLDLSDGRALGYRSLLLATGARARTLPFPGVHVLRTHADAVALRAQLAPGTRVGVIGGGFIGLELAGAASAIGCPVTVVELGPRLMGRAVPEEVATVLAARHVAAGVDVRCGAAVTAVSPGPSGTVIALAGGGRVEVDVVVAGIGAVPETGLAERAGLAVGDGIVVDERFATSAPGVFAAGDCCSYPHPTYGRLRLESWRAAREQGAAAARAMLGGTEPWTGVPWFWSDQHDHSLQVAGIPGAAATEVVRQRPDGVRIWFGLGENGRVVAAAAAGPGNSVAKDVKLAEMLIARGATPPAADLADPGIALKALLRVPVAV
ncbi:NAD(P)/FAD-dependent oxidoreductase [Pseudonocardia sp.]|uniref:NAD(P)/FAD-dependent oxidoreductase n=1 Tax=Pseudonocardia sp. TaxID=60912 RepID=UPI003D10D9E7